MAPTCRCRLAASCCGDGEISRRLALAGQGVTRLSLFHIGADIKAGRLVPVLEAYNPGDVEEVNVVYVGHGGRLPERMRAFIASWSRTSTSTWRRGRKLADPGEARLRHFGRLADW
jgi:DNA-binding transcriptional LysR family regulator